MIILSAKISGLSFLKFRAAAFLRAVDVQPRSDASGLHPYSKFECGRISQSLMAAVNSDTVASRQAISHLRFIKRISNGFS